MLSPSFCILTRVPLVQWVLSVWKFPPHWWFVCRMSERLNLRNSEAALVPSAILLSSLPLSEST